MRTSNKPPIRDLLMQLIRHAVQPHTATKVANVEDLDGQIIAMQPVGDFHTLIAVMLEGTFALARVNHALEFDTSFGPDNSGYVEGEFAEFWEGFSGLDGIVLHQGKILLTGEVFLFDSYSTKPALARYSLDGIADTTFGENGILLLDLPQPSSSAATFRARGTRLPSRTNFTLTDDDKILMLNLVLTADNLSDGTTQLIRLNADGSFDQAFNGTGVAHVTVNGQDIDPNGLQLLADGGILVHGRTQRKQSDTAYAIVARFTSGGQPDPLFGPENSPGFIAVGEADNLARFGALLVEPSGWLLAFGNLANDVLMARLSPAGKPDPDFNGGQPLKFSLPGANVGELQAVAVQEGRLVVAGSARVAGSYAGLLMRLLPNGDLDATFASGRGFSVADRRSEYHDVLIEVDNAILTSGYYAEGNQFHAWLRRHGLNGQGLEPSHRTHQDTFPVVAPGPRLS